MSTCNEPHHAHHDHEHGPNCGHTAIKHDDHIDYLHDGHLHHPHGDHVDEHQLEVSAKNPDQCTPGSGGHEPGHVHGPGCAMKRCRTGITSTISSTATCTIRTAITATTTARSTSHERAVAWG